jgi:hypothetical protein
VVAALGVGVVAKLIGALVDDGLLDKIVEKKLEGMGEEFIMKFLGGPFSLANRVDQAIETGGASEFARLRQEWLSNLQHQGQLPYGGVLRKIQNFTGHPGPYAGRNRRGRWAWQRADWAASRNDWLDNHWKHDWRSQPRDAQGRWIAGRLDYVPIYLQYRGIHKGRKNKRKARQRRLARMRGRRLARQMLRGI